MPTASIFKHLFALPMVVEDIYQAKLCAIPATTTKDTKYCVTIWNKWCSHRLTNNGDVIPLHEELNFADLAHY